MYYTGGRQMAGSGRGIRWWKGEEGDISGVEGQGEGGG